MTEPRYLKILMLTILFEDGTITNTAQHDFKSVNDTIAAQDKGIMMYTVSATKRQLLDEEVGEEAETHG